MEAKRDVLRENEVAILMELMDMLELKEAADMLARANGVRWYGRVLGSLRKMF